MKWVRPRELIRLFTYKCNFININQTQKRCYSKIAERVKKQEKKAHIPVMVNEVIEHLNLIPGNTLIDMTFGAGGHSEALLEKVPKLEIIALDRDPLVYEYAEELNKKYPGQVRYINGKFTDLPTLLTQLNIKPNTIDGILFDLGCSSMQFDTPERGFSIKENGPLDMRMDGNRCPGSVTAADVIAHATESELTKIFKIYGEEKRAKKIARAIEESRYVFKPLKTTHELRDLVQTVCKEVRHDKLERQTHVATKVFQALRIFVNNELNEINNGLLLAYEYLKPGGRCAVITFHSLEDIIAKRHFHNQLFDDNSKLPFKFFYMSKTFTPEEMNKYKVQYWEPINKKVIVPTHDEVELNPRSRSAKLRGAIKIK